jgi:cell division septation protein DedD
MVGSRLRKHTTLTSSLQNAQFRPNVSSSNFIPKTAFGRLDVFESQFRAKTTSSAANQATAAIVTHALIHSHTHKHTNTPFTSTTKHSKFGTTAHSLTPKHQLVSSCHPEATPIISPIAHKQAHLHTHETLIQLPRQTHRPSASRVFFDTPTAPFVARTKRNES